MLFSYPIAATVNNWLHDSLCIMLTTIHDAARHGRKALAWDSLITVVGQEKLQQRRALRDKVGGYQTAYRGLDAAGQTQVRNALIQQNAVENLLAGRSHCDIVTALPEAIRAPLSELFGCAFGLLTDLGIRDDMYECIYRAIPEKVCPFCGCERFDAPRGPREALDHYLARSIYPCAAANLRNLVPMGNKCNSRYKGGVDILRTPAGRRRAYFPYGAGSVSVSLDDSVPFEGAEGVAPRWEITFTPATEEVETWKHVFEIETRYSRDELDREHYLSFLREFSNWCKTAPGVTLPPSDNGLVELLGRYARNMELNGRNDRAFLKAAVFRMLHRHCTVGHPRLLAFIRDVVVG